MEEPIADDRTLRELPPRQLHWYAVLVLLFGNYAAQSGWLMLAAGSFFFWTTALRSEAALWIQQRQIPWEKVTGVVRSTDSLHRIEQGERIWACHYTFSLAGHRFSGTSYSVGKKFDAGQIVYIHYDPIQPRRNHIIGLRRSPYSAWLNLLLLIPLAGLLPVLVPLRKKLRFIRLLRYGSFTRGTLLSKNPTGQSIRRGATVLPVVKYLFQFEHQGTIHLASCRTAHTHLVEDEAAEIILYAPSHPATNVVYDAIPNVPDIGRDGRLLPIPFHKSWVVLLPVFTTVFNLLFLWQSLWRG